jgi:N-acetylneuraminate synthase
MCAGQKFFGVNMESSVDIQIGKKWIGKLHPSYFIADIAANHDGELERAKELIYLAKEVGADCAKFQHFKASKIVSDLGFKSLGAAKSHQSSWKKSVYEVYEKFELNREWNSVLAQTALQVGIDFMTTPYDIDAVDTVNSLVLAWKIGSGDITYTSFLEYVAKTNKPVFLATGASSMQDVERAVNAIFPINKKLVLMQCNTNYTGSIENFKYINLNVLKIYAQNFPAITLGLSDHSPGHSTVLGAIALGARVIEKHFTDDVSRDGPDHGFSMDLKTWREMIQRGRELESALGDGIKRVESNEVETAVLQQRCLRASKSLPVGHVLTSEDIEALRPATSGALRPYLLEKVIGKKIQHKLEFGEPLMARDFFN